MWIRPTCLHHLSDVMAIDDDELMKIVVVTSDIDKQ